MDNQQKKIKYLNSYDSSNWFQIEFDHMKEPNFVYSSASQYSTTFGSFAYKNKYQTVNFKGKLIYNTEKGYYEMCLESGRIEVSPKTLIGFSDGPSSIWEGGSFEEVVKRYDKTAVWFYNDDNSRFVGTPEPTVVLTNVQTPPQFCRFDMHDKHSTDFRMGDHWLPLATESSCLIF